MTNEFQTLSKAYKLIYYGLMLIVLAVVIGVLGGVMAGVAAGAAGAPGGGAFNLMAVMLIAAGVCYLIGAVLMIIGKIRCIAVPPEVDGAKTLIMLAVAFELITVLVAMLGIVESAGGRGIIDPSIKRVVDLGSNLMSIAASVLFLVFTARVARYIRRRDLAANAMLIIKIAVGLIVGVILMMVTTFMLIGAGAGPGVAGGRGGAAAGGLLACGTGIAVLVLAIAMLVLYARLLTSMSTACARYARDEDRYGPDDEVIDDNEDDLDR